MRNIVNTGKCPSCNELVTRALAEDLAAGPFASMETWATIAYLCPHCKTILGISGLPREFESALVAKIAAAVKA